MRSLIALGFLLGSCTAGSPYWQLDTIAAGDAAFDSARLRAIQPDSPSPLTFEFLKIQDQIEAFLSLTQFHFPLEMADPSTVKIIFSIENESFTEIAPLLEGKMRLRLSSKTTSRVTQALQEGKKVAILLGGFEKILYPEQFSHIYPVFRGQKTMLQNFIKGPLQ